MIEMPAARRRASAATPVIRPYMMLAQQRNDMSSTEDRVKRRDILSVEKLRIEQCRRLTRAAAAALPVTKPPRYATLRRKRALVEHMVMIGAMARRRLRRDAGCLADAPSAHRQPHHATPSTVVMLPPRYGTQCLQQTAARTAPYVAPAQTRKSRQGAPVAAWSAAHAGHLPPVTTPCNRPCATPNLHLPASPATTWRQGTDVTRMWTVGEPRTRQKRGRLRAEGAEEVLASSILMSPPPER